MPSLKHLLTFSLTLPPPYHRPHLSALPLSSSFHLPNNLNRLLTGNCLFYRMEPAGTPKVDAAHRKNTTLQISNSNLVIERFWSGSGINKNKAMVENLQHYGVITSRKVAEVMETVDRALFVPAGTPPYVDSPMAIGYNATISAPHMHAMCLQLLEGNLKPGMHALDVGSGTGYLTACFAIMVGPQGRTVGVEHIPELVTSSIKNIEKSAAALAALLYAFSN